MPIAKPLLSSRIVRETDTPLSRPAGTSRVCLPFV